MNKILRLVCRQADFKKIVSIGFFAAFLAVFLSAGTAQAGFWDWFNLNKANNDSQQAAAIANAETTYKWVNNGLVSESEGRYTGNSLRPKKQVKTITCNSSTKGDKLYDGTDRGSSYGDTGGGHAWPIYEGENTSIATEYTYDDNLAKRTGGTVNEWECKSSDSTTVSSSSSSLSSSSSSSSSSAKTYQLQIKITGAGSLDAVGSSVSGTCSRLSNGKYKLDDGITDSVCRYNLKEGDKVTLTPSSGDTGYELGAWANACRNYQKTASCVVTMGKSNQTASATFNKKIVDKKGNLTGNDITVSVRQSGNGDGRVVTVKSSSEGIKKETEDGKINCGDDCSENYSQCVPLAEGSLRDNGNVNDYNAGCPFIYFKATPSKGSAFGGWSGTCVSLGGTKKNWCKAAMDGDKNIIAIFNKEGESSDPKSNYYDLAVTVSEGGAVKSTDNRIKCGSGNSKCKYSYKKNGAVTLKATPNRGYVLGDFSGCASHTTSRGILTCKVKMTNNQNVTINFNASGTSGSSSSSSSTSAKQTASTGTATNITSTSAKLTGTVNTQGNDNVYFEIRYIKSGTSGTGSGTGLIKLSNEISGNVAHSMNVSGLTPGTKYDYYISTWIKKDGQWSVDSYVSGGVKSFTTKSND